MIASMLRQIVLAAVWLIGLSVFGCQPPTSTSLPANLAQDQDQGPKAITSAKEYLENLDEGKFLKLELNQAEQEKLVQHFRELFPFESITDRLRKVENVSRIKQLRTLSRPHSVLENQFETYRGRRVDAMAMLHSEKANEFVSTPEFGYERMIPITPRDLKRQRRNSMALETEYESEVEIESGPIIELVENESSESGNETPTKNAVTSLYFDGKAQFANPEWNGLVRDREHVAGFLGHEIETVWNPDLGTYVNASPAAGSETESKTKWKLNRLELVSLLAHDEFQVYVSESLPRMDELNEAKTRNLDVFEFQSLGKLFQGEEVITQATPNRIRMLGALRADKSCLECHSVHEGELLGALSYELLRRPKISIAKDDEVPPGAAGSGNK